VPRFSAFPDDEIEVFGGRRVTFAGPEGSDIGDLDTMVLDDPATCGMPRVVARIELEQGDLEKLTAGAPIYLIQYGGCIPICVDIPFEVWRAEGASPGGHHVTPQELK
jgi:hypothetical protein